MSKTQTGNRIQTGSANLKRKWLFNKTQDQVDIPDGDIQLGKKIYNDQCASCHHLSLNTLSPPLGDIYGKSSASVKGFNYYSFRCRSLNYRWSRHRLYKLMENPELVLGLQSGMTFSGLTDVYQRSCVIDYMCYLRMTRGNRVQPHWIN